ncbi:hypothetical protein G6F57_009706 [Rhizopus arrhizus]|uniref:Uncharacterized protein n=1 Tax=Rhizopus oryzae TaxID=64495 RepID=A0A9P6X4N2_RHIOR|nr:hypothetical protein G6F23_006366 [Rhizopus arrhizus]KAG1419623.1 hypothetical protein G6F58_004514 [Rhizopus delemar]KAG0758647.1 hypothetical protein G6F24_009650 [Rhizopus arrhizus]KAG0786345.1 hypothetical protein G6F21_008656 [Rhizopus arrhizus]KAG0808888.1 hypothetical protein G6F20_009212 [Rhizopus arrhizus]
MLVSSLLFGPIALEKRKDSSTNGNSPGSTLNEFLFRQCAEDSVSDISRIVFGTNNPSSADSQDITYEDTLAR